MKPKEFWLITEDWSNRSLTRQPGEKYSDDVNEEPSSKWIHVIEKSAYDQLLEQANQLAEDLIDAIAGDPYIVRTEALHAFNQFKKEQGIE